MSDAQHAAITTELVRLTIGGPPERPELIAPLVDPATKKPTHKNRRTTT